MANTFVNDNTVKKADEDRGNAKCLFKMKKFMIVEPRTSSQNPGYTATKRDTAGIGMRPNPILCGK